MSVGHELKNIFKEKRGMMLGVLNDVHWWHCELELDVGQFTRYNCLVATQGL